MNRLLRFFSPSGQQFYDCFKKAGNNLVDAAKLLESLLNAPKSEHKAIVKNIGEHERQGDKITSTIINMLNNTFVTPFEREDIYELASTLDDILDSIEDTAGYVIMYQLGKIRPQAKDQAVLIMSAAQNIKSALDRLSETKELSPYIKNVKLRESEGDKLMRVSMAELFKDEDDSKKLIAWKDMFESLEKTLNAAEHHANVLKGIAIQNS